MDREQIAKYIKQTHHADAEYPWIRCPRYMVFRHSDNQKWFAIVMDISKKKLGLPEDEIIDILNVKCDPVLLGTLKGRRGFYPAYHMNKACWITISLDGSVDDETIRWLLDMSFGMTLKKIKR